MKVFTSSIRKQLLCWLMAPVIVLIAIDAVIANFLVVNLTTDVYDDSLIESARAVAGQLCFQEDTATINLPDTAIAMLKFNQKDLLFCQVLSSDRHYLAGDREIPPPPELTDFKKPNARDGLIGKQRVRIAALSASLQTSAGKHVIVQVAETKQALNELIGTIILTVILSQLVLLLLTGLAIWFGIKQGLRPLQNLQMAVGKRSAVDLSPIDEVTAPREVKPLVQSINQLLQRLREDRDAQRRFVANAAHQLRTPLAGLKTQTELAQRQHNAEDIHQSLTRIYTSAERANRLVRQLLTLARVEPAVFQSMRLKAVNLREVTQNACRELVPQALAKDIDLGIEGTAFDTTIEGDAESLQELAVNLIENAVVYTQPGGKVTVSLHADSASVSLQVEDNGPGIATQERERIFERFYRPLNTGTSGSGLGLAIVREIAECHQAAVEVSTGHDGLGTQISVRFPVDARTRAIAQDVVTAGAQTCTGQTVDWQQVDKKMT